MGDENLSRVIKNLERRARIVKKLLGVAMKSGSSKKLAKLLIRVL
jgi:hypothetical protein